MLPLLLALTVAVAVGDDAEALEKFKADIKGKDGAGRAAAVEELAKTSSPKVCSKLASLLTNEVVEVKISAAKGFEIQEDKKHAAVYLLNGAQANAKEFTVLAAILEALGKVKEEIGAPEINKHFSRGGRGSGEERRRCGGRPEKRVLVRPPHQGAQEVRSP